MRRALRAIVPALMAWGCDSTEPSAITTVVIAPTTLAFDAHGARDTLSAEVLDQRGKPMKGVPLSWSKEGAAVDIVPIGGDSAIVIAVGNGSAIVRASAGPEARGEAAATVTQTAANIFGVSGQNQRRPVGTTLPEPIVVAVRDRNGNGVPGVPVAFSVTTGNGSLSASEAVTGEFGTATVSWTLGTSTSTGQQITATAEGVAAPAIISATAAPGVEAQIAIVRGDDQSVATSTWVPILPTVRVLDAHGNVVPSVTVSFSVVQGGGTVFGPNGQTNNAGEFSPQGWALGFDPGENILRARVPNRDLSVDFRATAIAPPTISVSAGASQAAMVSTALPRRPSFIVRDGFRAPIPGVTVNFTVVEGDGTLTTLRAVTDADGIASPGEWTLGPVANRNRITARAEYPGLETTVASLDAYGCSSGSPAGYSITLCYVSAVTPAQRLAFDAAAARWSTVIVGDVPNFDVGFSAPCQGWPSIEMTIDDLLIFVSVTELDGSGGLLGQAGACRLRVNNFLPFAGVMQFDRTDVQNMNPSLFETVILHEMAHVIGVGSLWGQPFELIVDASSTTNRRDTHYTGAAGRAAFDAIGGTAYTGGAKVPVENEGGQGTMNGHWRESVLRNELMTGFVNAGSNPLSLLTIRSLEDLGYVVNTAVAEPFTYTPSAGLRGAGDGADGVDLGNDILDMPIWVSDESGREVRIR